MQKLTQQVRSLTPLASKITEFAEKDKLRSSIGRILRSAETACVVGRDRREGELAYGDRGAVIGGEPRGPDAAASGADGEEVEVEVLRRRLGGAILGGGVGGGAGAEAAAGLEGGA